MDLNYLYFRQQVELARADEAQCSESADAHRHLADLYGSLIESSKEAARSAAAEEPPTLQSAAETAI
jgi:hypothetical protein